MASEMAKLAGLSGQESRPEQGLKGLRHIKEFILRINDEQWKTLDENASSMCSRADFAGFCTKIEALVSNSGSPKCSPSLTGTIGKEAVLPVDGGTRRRWECDAGAPSTSSQRAPEGHDARICRIIGDMVKAMQMPVQEANQSSASYQTWTPVKEKTELRQETDAEVSSFPDDLRASPLVEARPARFKRPGNSAQETATGRNSQPEDPLDLDRTHVTFFVEDPGWGTSKDLPSYPCRADSALVPETSKEASHHRSTSPARPVPAAAKRRKRPTFRFGKKLNKVHPFGMPSEEHQASSSGSPQQASHGESEASASPLKKLRMRLSRIFRVLAKA